MCIFVDVSVQKVCEKCDGYGVQQCHVCQGRGVLTWEGKLRHTDPCPLCFGSCLKKVEFTSRCIIELMLPVLWFHFSHGDWSMWIRY